MSFASPQMTDSTAARTNNNSSYVSRRFGEPVRQETEAGVVRMISEQVALDKNVEMAKNETVSCHDFNTYDAFRIFDIDNLGTITALDLQHGLSDIGVHVSTDDIHLFFQRFDKNRDGRLDLREFAAALTPEDPYYANILARRPSSHRRINIYRKDDVFAHPTSYAFKNLLRTMLSTEGAAEATRQTLQRNPYFDPSVAFSMVDYNANGLVSKDEIRYMMESKGHFISDQEAR